MGLVVDGSAEPIEANDSEDDDDNHEDESELWLVHSMVLSC